MEKDSTPKTEPDLLFCGLIFQANEETYKRIKDFILKETTVKLINQKKSPEYLTVTKTDKLVRN